MEPKFKTSFIPKASLGDTATQFVPHKRTGTGLGIGAFVSFVIFLLAVGSAVLLFIYKQVLEGQIVSKTEQLNRAREAFAPATIEEIARLDARIEAAKYLLERHIAPSAIFKLLEDSTLLSVQFQSLTYSRQPDGLMFVSLQGRGRDYASVALQSDEFAKNRYLKNPIVGNLTLDGGGRVGFEVRAELDPRVISFVGAVPSAAETESSSVETTSSSSSSGAGGDPFFGESQ